MRSYRVLGLVVLSLLGSGWLLTGPPARAAVDSDLIEIAPDRVTLTPPSPYAWAILRMTGPGEWEHTEVFRAEDPIAFHLDPDAVIPDGSVEWELTLRPRDAQDPRARQRHHGRFRIEAGAMVPFPEPGPRTGRSTQVAERSAAGIGADAVTAPADQHIDGDLTVTGGVCAGCASGTGLNIPPFVDAWFHATHRVAFGNGTDPTVVLEWDDMAERLVLFTPLVAGDSQTSFREYEVGLSTANLPKELNLAGKPLPDPVFPGTVRSIPEIRFQAVTDPLLGNLSTRNWDLGASTGSFFVRDATAGTVPLELVAGAGGKIRVADGGVDIEGELLLPQGGMTAQTVRLSSSRSMKERLVAVDGDEMLQRLVRIPIYEWSFRDDPSGARHVGPMSEEFHAAVPLAGQSVAHLSVTDLAGVSLAAIQALESRVAAVEAENRQLSAAIAGREGGACGESPRPPTGSGTSERSEP